VKKSIESIIESPGDLDAVRSLPLKSTLGQMVPLGDVAVSAVDEARAAIDAKVKLRPATGSRGAGSSALRQRSSPVDGGGPLALALILFLLWMAFGRVKPALLVFINIPFAAIGGILLLWLRGISFSISAGVGFIALFGVAVLNGLVLISFCLHLQSKGTAAREAIVEAATLRLRPVVMTALVAALGFLPMALSNAPGAEVQRPLATVVIGGLVTATALTLLRFSAVYALAHRGAIRGSPPAGSGISKAAGAPV
jgi:cobalt-zinc-cadmium resistance protein CzcA